MSKSKYAFLEAGGKCWIETIKFAFTGAIEDITEQGIHLKQAAIWHTIVEWAKTMRTGVLDPESQVEILPEDMNLFLPWGGITYIADWKHNLPPLEEYTEDPHKNTFLQ